LFQNGNEVGERRMEKRGDGRGGERERESWIRAKENGEGRAVGVRWVREEAKQTIECLPGTTLADNTHQSSRKMRWRRLTSAKSDEYSFLQARIENNGGKSASRKSRLYRETNRIDSMTTNIDHIYASNR
jgi:hypothetical protein